MNEKNESDPLIKKVSIMFVVGGFGIIIAFTILSFIAYSSGQFKQEYYDNPTLIFITLFADPMLWFLIIIGGVILRNLIKGDK